MCLYECEYDINEIKKRFKKESRLIATVGYCTICRKPRVFYKNDLRGYNNI